MRAIDAAQNGVDGGRLALVVDRPPGVEVGVRGHVGDLAPAVRVLVLDAERGLPRGARLDRAEAAAPAAHRQRVLPALLLLVRPVRAEDQPRAADADDAWARRGPGHAKAVIGGLDPLALVRALVAGRDERRDAGRVPGLDRLLVVLDVLRRVLQLA